MIQCNVLSSKAKLKTHQKIHNTEFQKRRKEKEDAFQTFLDDEKIPYERETYIDFKCSDKKRNQKINLNETKYSRIDFVIFHNNIYFLVEIDEYQHTSYNPDCEIVRMTSIFTSAIDGGNDLPMVFVRFNPDAFKIQGQTQKFPLKKRYATILKFIQEYQPEQPLAIRYFFYSDDSLDDPDYDPIRGLILD